MSYSRGKYYIIPTIKDGVDGVEFFNCEAFVSDDNLDVLLFKLSNNRPKELEHRINHGKELLGGETVYNSSSNLKLSEQEILDIGSNAVRNIIEKSDLKGFMAQYYSLCGTSMLTEMTILMKEKGFFSAEEGDK